MSPWVTCGVVCPSSFICLTGGWALFQSAQHSPGLTRLSAISCDLLCLCGLPHHCCLGFASASFYFLFKRTGQDFLPHTHPLYPCRVSFTGGLAPTWAKSLSTANKFPISGSVCLSAYGMAACCLNVTFRGGRPCITCTAAGSWELRLFVLIKCTPISKYSHKVA